MPSEKDGKDVILIILNHMVIEILKKMFLFKTNFPKFRLAVLPLADDETLDQHSSSSSMPSQSLLYSLSSFLHLPCCPIWLGAAFELAFGFAATIACRGSLL